MMMSGYDFDAYVHSIARREPRRLPACFLDFFMLNITLLQFLSSHLQNLRIFLAYVPDQSDSMSFFSFQVQIMYCIILYDTVSET